MFDDELGFAWVDAPGPDRIPEWMGPEDFVSESERAANRLVLVPVGAWDLRTLRAAERAQSIPARARRALHVVGNDRVTHALLRAWPRNGGPFPLSFVENDGGIPATIARVVELELVSGFDEVVVIAGRLTLQGPLEWLVHDHTASRIGRAVSPIPATVTGLVAVPARP
jgi:hypothetical protein